MSALEIMAKHARELRALLERCEADPDYNPEAASRIRNRLSEAQGALDAMRNLNL